MALKSRVEEFIIPDLAEIVNTMLTCQCGLVNIQHSCVSICEDIMNLWYEKLCISPLVTKYNDVLISDLVRGSSRIHPNGKVDCVISRDTQTMRPQNMESYELRYLLNVENEEKYVKEFVNTGELRGKQHTDSYFIWFGILQASGLGYHRVILKRKIPVWANAPCVFFSSCPCKRTHGIDRQVNTMW